MPPAPEAAPLSINVTIYDQVYHLRGTDPAHIERLAATVDAKMRAVAAHGNTVDSLRIAVLAALNLADELATLRDRTADTAVSSQQTLRTLTGILDDVLTEADAATPGSRRAG